jgi:hypothetical protein
MSVSSREHSENHNWRAIYSKFPELKDSMHIPDCLTLNTLNRKLPKLLQFEDFWVHENINNEAVSAPWPPAKLRQLTLVPLLAAFSCPLTLNLITINLENISSNLNSTCAYLAPPFIKATLFVAVGKYWADFTCLDNTSGQLPVWLEFNAESLGNTIEAMRVLDAKPRTNEERWVFANFVL